MENILSARFNDIKADERTESALAPVHAVNEHGRGEARAGQVNEWGSDDGQRTL
jgi:hypothetical protein